MTFYMCWGKTEKQEGSIQYGNIIWSVSSAYSYMFEHSSFVYFSLKNIFFKAHFFMIRAPIQIKHLLGPKFSAYQIIITCFKSCTSHIPSENHFEFKIFIFGGEKLLWATSSLHNKTFATNIFEGFLIQSHLCLGCTPQQSAADCFIMIMCWHVFPEFIRWYSQIYLATRSGQLDACPVCLRHAFLIAAVFYCCHSFECLI